MEWFELPTDKDLFLTEVVWPNIKNWDYDNEGHFVIREWSPGTPDKVKEKVEHDYDDIVVAAS